MRLALDPRAKRLLRRLPRTSAYGLVEIILLVLLALQAARLLWAIVTPVGPLGEWRPQNGLIQGAAERSRLLGAFDPFFRQDGAPTEAVVTSLQLTLFGVRIDEAMGRGSAIIGAPDGVQNSYAVGDEILPGVTLKAVQFDSVTILRGGAEEQLFLDQSAAAVPAGVPAQADSSDVLDAPGGPAPGSQGIAPQALLAEIDFSPRLDEGQVTGFVVRPKGSGAAFNVSGLREGDVVTAVNNRKITTAGDLERIATELAGRGGNITLSVERGAQVVPIAIMIAKQ